MSQSGPGYDEGKHARKATLTMTFPAHELLELLDRSSAMPRPTDADAARVFEAFISHLRFIERLHLKKQWTERYLIEGVFARARQFNNDAETSAYCRRHLKIAVKELVGLIPSLIDTATGQISLDKLDAWRDTLRDYVFNLNEIIPFLQRNKQGYIFLRGGKNYHVHSWEVFLFAKALAFQSAFRAQNNGLEHKAAQIAAIAVLRQAMELRFERLISVYLIDPNGKSPRLRHGFHQEFIEKHPRYFKADGFVIKDLRPLYDWCSEIVHQVYPPYAWQISWALELAGRLLGSRQVDAGEHWSIDNGVEVIDVAEMQTAFEEHFITTYEHGSWKMIRHKPEALVRDWDKSMNSTSPNFRPVKPRPRR